MLGLMLCQASPFLSARGAARAVSQATGGAHLMRFGLEDSPCIPPRCGVIRRRFPFALTKVILMLGLLNPSEQSEQMTTSAPANRTPGASKQRANRPRLLVLDTSKYQRLFDAILGHDYELLATDQPGEAIMIATSENPDLILLSHSTETSDGIMVAREIRETASSIVPILIMLTKDLPTLRREATKAGCNGFLIKPVDPDKLKAQIEQWLNPQPE
jgi:CheY-like chemotaxis protein